MVAVLLGLSGGTAIGLAVGYSTEGAAVVGNVPVAPPAVAGPVGPPTLYGQVVDVPNAGSVVVDVAGRRIPVDVLGIDTSTIPACAAPGALAFARETLAGETVTLVPDPTVAPASVRQAYVVLSSQLSYTDAALRAGWATPGRSTALYRPIFDAETRQARNSGVGMWGPACS